MMEIGDRRAERVEAALSLIFASPLEGGVANERCNVSVSLAVGQDNDIRSIGGKNISLSFMRALVPLRMSGYTRSSKEIYIWTIENGPLHLLGRVLSLRLSEPGNSATIAWKHATQRGGLMTYGASPPSRISDGFWSCMQRKKEFSSC